MKVVPTWASTTAMQALMNMLVDRLDSADLRGSAKAQSVALSERTWPAFHASPFESDKEALWEHVREMVTLGWVSIKPERASKSISGYDLTPRISVVDETALRQATNRPTRELSYSERWRMAVDEHFIGPEQVRSIVVSYCMELPGHSPENIVQRLNMLKDIVGSELLFLREASAKLFWGISKALDGRQPLVAAILGMNECPFPEAPVQLHVQLPTGEMAGVLFIENLTTYERAVRAGSAALASLALVYAAGFKASARRLRSLDGASLYYARGGALGSEEVSRFESWLFSENCELPVYFWGDLDWSGIRILQTLRKTFTTARAWQPGYAPMLVQLTSGRGHEPAAADKSGQQPVHATGCQYADTALIPALTQLQAFVDQEFTGA